MRRAFFALSAVVAAALAPGSGRAADCDVSYVLQPGDTLPIIAETAYGRSSYQLIYARNFNVITDLATLPVGETIVIPCVEGGGFTPDAAALAARMGVEPEDVTGETSAAAAADPVEDDPAEAPVEDAAEAEDEDPPLVAPREGASIRILMASDLAPYADETLRNGGMATELTRLAMAKAGVGDDYKIVVIDDRGAHLDDLLTEGSFALSFPWLQPRCDDLEALRALAPDEAAICDGYVFSEPFYEFVYGFFVRKGEYSTDRTDFGDFVGRSVCRPAGGPVMDLAVKGLTEDEVDLVRAATVGDCFALLSAGEVDAVSAEIFEAEDVLTETGLFDQVEEMPRLSLLWTVHAIAARDKAEATAAMEKLNEGLTALKVSGRWFRVVARHLALQNGG